MAADLGMKRSRCSTSSKSMSEGYMSICGVSGQLGVYSDRPPSPYHVSSLVANGSEIVREKHPLDPNDATPQGMNLDARMAALASDLERQLALVALILGAVKAEVVGIAGEVDVGLLHDGGPVRR